MRSFFLTVRFVVAAAALGAVADAQSRLHRLRGETLFETLGYRLSRAGDVNGDGFQDVLAGAPFDSSNTYQSGKAVVFSGLDGSILVSAYGQLPVDRLGRSVGGGEDVNGDGVVDMVVGSGLGAGGEVLVVSGQNGDVLHRFPKPVTNTLSFFGEAVSLGRDVDGDGQADILASSLGIAEVYSGATGALVHSIPQPAPDAYGFGLAAAFVGDVDGDGSDDFAVGARSDQASGSQKGSVYVFSGADGSILFRVDGRSYYDRFGSSVAAAGDVNGDGTPDLIVGAEQGQCGRAGYARVHSGVDGALLFEFRGNAVCDNFSRVAGVGDVNLDGFDDLAVGASEPLQTSGGRGEVRVLSGKDGLPLTTLRASPGEEGYGYSVAGLGDANGDGHPDFAIGAPGTPSSTGVTSAGLVEVRSGACFSIRRYCSTGTNSLGFKARMELQGTTSVADDDFAVTVRHLPAGRPGLFFFGDAQVQTPFGDGYRCVAGNVFRARPFAHADAAGVATRTVALSGSPIVPGSTWNFQLWYRDSGPSGFNLSDALELSFCP